MIPTPDNIARLPKPLRALREDILTCFNCGDYTERALKSGPNKGDIRRTYDVPIPKDAIRLTDSSRMPVAGFGGGRRWYFIGEAPGEMEDREGVGFIGRSGGYLRYTLIERCARLKPSQCWFSNVVRCHPKDNRDPYAAEVNACAPHTLKEIKLLDPECIVAVGRFSSQFFIPGVSLRAGHGYVYSWESPWGKVYPVFVMYHPAAADRAVAKKVIEDDFKKVHSRLAHWRAVQQSPLDYDTTLVRTTDALEDVLAILEDERITSFALDIETNESEWSRKVVKRPDPLTNELAGVALAWKDGETGKRHGVYIPTCYHPDSRDEIKPEDFGYERWTAFRIALVARIARIAKAKKVYIHNAKFEAESLTKYLVASGSITPERYDFFELFPRTVCTLLCSYLVREPTLNLKEVVKRRFGYQMTMFDDVVDLKKGAVRDFNLEDIYPYACDDAVWCYELGEDTEAWIDAKKKREQYDILHDLLPWVVDCELRGIAISEDTRQKLIPVFAEELQNAETVVHSIAGRGFNIDSAKQKSDLLFKEIRVQDIHNELAETVPGISTYRPKLTPGSKGKAEHLWQWSTQKRDLEPLKDSHPIIAAIMEYGSIRTNKSTFVEGLPKQQHPRTRLIHPSINQAVTETSRLSYSGPNVQNIPVRTLLGKQIRKLFIAQIKAEWAAAGLPVPSGDELVIWAIDQSQIEIRVAAHLSKDPVMIATLLAGRSIHRVTREMVYDIEYDADEDFRRAGDVAPPYKLSKNGNFAELYLVTIPTLASTFECSLEEAEEFDVGHKRTYAGYHRWTRKQVARSRQLGYTETLFGFRRYIPDIQSRTPWLRSQGERYAVNVPVQGTAAGIIQRATARCHRWLRSTRKMSRIIFNVHDELVGVSPIGEVLEVVEYVADTLANSTKLDVPTPVDIEIGRENWGDLMPWEQFLEEEGF